MVRGNVLVPVNMFAQMVSLHSVLEGGGLEKVLILKRFLHFSGQSDGGEW